MTTTGRTLGLCLLLASVGFGEQKGLLVDPSTRSLRPVFATKDAIWTGGAAIRTAEWVAAAPNGRMALVQNGSSVYVVRRLDGGIPVWREMLELPDGAARPEQAVWSSDSSAAVLFSSRERILELWSGLGSDPKREGSIDLWALDGRVISFTVGKDGRQAFFTTEGENGGSLYVAKAGELPRLILPLGRAGALSLNKDRLYVADRGRNEVLRLSQWDTSLKVELAAAPGHGVADPVGIDLSEDGKTLVIANAGSRQLISLETDSWRLRSVRDLDFRPTGLDRSGGLFVTCASSVAWMMDTTTLTLVEIPTVPEFLLTPSASAQD